MKLSRNTKEKIAGAILLTVAILLLAAGSVRKHKVYDPSTEEYGIVAFERISEWALIEDSTFGGVRLDKGLVYSTYDRAQPRGKKACPT